MCSHALLCCAYVIRAYNFAWQQRQFHRVLMQNKKEVEGTAYRKSNVVFKWLYLLEFNIHIIISLRHIYFLPTLQGALACVGLSVCSTNWVIMAETFAVAGSVMSLYYTAEHSRE